MDSVASLQIFEKLGHSASRPQGRGDERSRLAGCPEQEVRHLIFPTGRRADPYVGGARVEAEHSVREVGRSGRFACFTERYGYFVGRSAFSIGGRSFYCRNNCAFVI